ncbi:hypothetical protein [Mesorhizobium sanjuanii]|uniref:hypothetical protein n=1 Tax=Mesorhizobium sanjuanii TaxID=2037900 RepID=UPI001AD808D7|nr:hypothetical protein [Mesorhizobium sanjuanii]
MKKPAEAGFCLWCVGNGQAATNTSPKIMRSRTSLSSWRRRPAPAEPQRTAVKPALSDYQLHKSLVKLTRKKKPRT